MGCTFLRPKAPPSHAEDDEDVVHRFAMDRLQNVSLFSVLTEEDKLDVKEVLYHAGEDIIVQGTDIHSHDSWIYVIKEGSCEALEDGQRVNVMRQGEILGERALLQNLPRRTATVRCLSEECLVVGIGIRSLEKALGLEHELNMSVVAEDGSACLAHQEVQARLKAFPILQTMSDFHLRSLASKVRVLRRSPGDLILRKDESGEEFFLLDRGRIGVLKEDEEERRRGSGQPLDLGDILLRHHDEDYQDEDEGESGEGGKMTSARAGAEAGEEGGAATSNVLFRAFMGTFTSSQSKLHASGIANAILAYAAASLSPSSSSSYAVEGTTRCPLPSPTKVPASRIKATLHAGMFFGEAALLGGDGRRGASIVALTHCTLLVLDRPTFTRLMATLENPPSPDKSSKGGRREEE
jgi:CRP-like cAMP-binding protein